MKRNDDVMKTKPRSAKGQTHPRIKMGQRARLLNELMDTHKLRYREAAVLRVLADYLNDECRCWPSQVTIAGRAHCSERTVRRAIESLKDRGIVTEKKRNYGADRKSSVLTVHFSTGHCDRSTNIPTGQPVTSRPANLTGKPPTKNRSTKKKIKKKIRIVKKKKNSLRKGSTQTTQSRPDNVAGRQMSREEQEWFEREMDEIHAKEKAKWAAL